MSVINANETEIGRQNWEVCQRMLFHDLLDMATTNPEIKALLEFYFCDYTPDGGYTLALPRLKFLSARALEVKPTKPQAVKKKKK